MVGINWRQILTHMCSCNKLETAEFEGNTRKRIRAYCAQNLGIKMLEEIVGSSTILTIKIQVVLLQLP
jgi:hypothetical protein